MTSWREAERTANAQELEQAIEEAKRRADILGDAVVRVPAPAPAPIGRRVVVIEHFSLSMIDFGDSTGACVDVRQISKTDAQRIAYEARAEVANVLPERSVQMLERELQIPSIDRIRLVPGVMFLCVEPVRWNDVRFYLVHITADGDGVVY